MRCAIIFLSSLLPHSLISLLSYSLSPFLLLFPCTHPSSTLSPLLPPPHPFSPSSPPPHSPFPCLFAFSQIAVLVKDSSQSSIVDKVFKQSLKEFHTFLISTYSLSLQVRQPGRGGGRREGRGWLGSRWEVGTREGRSEGRGWLGSRWEVGMREGRSEGREFSLPTEFNGEQPRDRGHDP